MLEILDDIVNGRGTIDQIDTLLELADTLSHTSLCGLGKTAASPIVSTIAQFREEYLAHVVDKRCPAKSCSGLKRIEILADKCKGCSKCQRVCPVNAISGQLKEPYFIDQQKCIKCKVCIDACNFFKAIVEE